MLIEELRAHLLTGHVIPAHPLALTENLAIDEKHQRALTRYYVASGAGGIAVGVHTTGFPVHDPNIGLYEPVLALAEETATRALQESTASARSFVRVAGLVGSTRQALREASIARALKYDCGLLALGAWRDATSSEILAHCRHVADAIPLFGFYLQPAVGGRVLDYDFWRRFCEIDNVVAIKVAPFNRYATLDVVRAVSDSGRRDIALYTGNDDAILSDLLMDASSANDRFAAPAFVGGLLGQWAVWTRNAVQLLNDVRAWRTTGTTDGGVDTRSNIRDNVRGDIRDNVSDETRSNIRDKVSGDTRDNMPREWLRLGTNLTVANAAIFDVVNNFAGCLPGILQVLRQQGLVRNTLTLDAHERLSAGQTELIALARSRFPYLTDDLFVAEHLDEWLR